MRPDFTQVDKLFLTVRFLNEVHDVKEFVTPNQYHVQKALDELGSDPMSLWDFVCRDVKYPLDRSGKPNEYHLMDSYAFRSFFVSGAGTITIPHQRQVVCTEWFDMPYEVLSQKPMIADCDGCSILLCSLLRGVGLNSFVAIGGLQGDNEPITHAWVVVDYQGEWQIWESLLPEAGPALPESDDSYIPQLYFNDQEIWESPNLMAMMKSMDYVPTVSKICERCSVGCNTVQKKQAIESLFGSMKECLPCRR